VRTKTLEYQLYVWKRAKKKVISYQVLRTAIAKTFSAQGSLPP